MLQQLNIHPYASSVTLLSAYDGSVIVNTTNYITDVYQQWNVTTQAQCKLLTRLSVASQVIPKSRNPSQISRVSICPLCCAPFRTSRRTF